MFNTSFAKKLHDYPLCTNLLTPTEIIQQELDIFDTFFEPQNGVDEAIGIVGHLGQ